MMKTAIKIRKLVKVSLSIISCFGDDKNTKTIGSLEIA